MKLNEKIKRIHEEDNNGLLSAINDSNIILRVKAICEAAGRKNSYTTFQPAIEEAKLDERVFWNQYRVCDFAIAALDVMGLQKYKGKNEVINGLIQSKLQFFAQ